MLKKLTKITDVQVGDYLSIIHPDFSYPTLAEVTAINTQHNFCSFKSLDKTYSSRILENELKQTILLRKSKSGLDILAGEEAYKKLTEPKQSRRVSKSVLGALARVCLKEGDAYDNM